MDHSAVPIGASRRIYCSWGPLLWRKHCYRTDDWSWKANGDSGATAFFCMERHSSSSDAGMGISYHFHRIP